MEQDFFDGNEGDSRPEVEGAKLCTFDKPEGVTGRFCILLDEHTNNHRVFEPPPDSPQWDEPEWVEYERVFGRGHNESEFVGDD